MKPKEKKKIKGIGNVYPCPICGKYPEWGAFFLICPNMCIESDYNEPKGRAVRTWNKQAADVEAIVAAPTKEYHVTAFRKFQVKVRAKFPVGAFGKAKRLPPSKWIPVGEYYGFTILEDLK